MQSFRDKEGDNDALANLRINSSHAKSRQFFNINGQASTFYIKNDGGLTKLSERPIDEHNFGKSTDPHTSSI